MGKVIVFTNVSLDGVMQAPARPDEDRRGGFEHGGWGAPYNAMMYARTGDTGTAAALLLGRRTYENFYAVWPSRTDDPLTERLNNMQKYVASTTLSEPLPWINSTLLKGDIVEAITRLKQQPDVNFLVMGSGDLVQFLMRHSLVDEYILLIHPLILGSGRRLFPDGSTFTTLRLVDSQTTPDGVVIVTYQPLETATGKTGEAAAY